MKNINKIKSNIENNHSKPLGYRKDGAFAFCDAIIKPIIPNENKSIMTFSFLETKSFLRDCMERFYNYHQKAFDSNDKELSDFFWSSYKEICDIYINLSSNDSLTDKIRNNIRSSVKETEKMAIVLLDNVK